MTQNEFPYHKAVHFSDERNARRVYVQIQETIRGPKCDLSVYRFQYQGVNYVAVLGDQPPEELQTTIEALLSIGESVTLPDEVVAYLRRRRQEARHVGPWVEGHYRFRHKKR